MSNQQNTRIMVGSVITIAGLLVLMNSRLPAPKTEVATTQGNAAPAPVTPSPTVGRVFGSDDDVVGECERLVALGTPEGAAGAVALTLEKTKAQRYSFLSVGCTVYEILPFSSPDRWQGDLANQVLRGGEHTRRAVRQELALATKRLGEHNFKEVFAALFPGDDPAAVGYDDSMIAMAALAKMIVATAELPSDELNAAVWEVFESVQGRFYDNYDLLDNKSVEDDDNLVLACAVRLGGRGDADRDAAFLKYARDRAPISKYYRGPLEKLIERLSGE
ncbi:MAG: hypothetical protein ACYTGQ_05620 [Planctomycetota bacterium]